MATPTKHALLSASSASRWLACTAAPRFEAQFPESTSGYAKEGQLAHSVCELKLRKKFLNLPTRSYNAQLNKLKRDELWADEMERCSELYMEHLTERAMCYSAPPAITAEVQVDLSEYIPEGFGTCDCVMIGGEWMDIIDYKHGKGVRVSPECNPQLRLYALGALKRYRMIYGDTIKHIRTTIFQPRINETAESEVIEAGELLSWGEKVKALAQLAYSGQGVFCPGEHCRFCRGKAKCSARADVNTALEEFKDCVPESRATSGQEILTDEQIGDLLIRGKELVKWYEDLTSYALSACLTGKEIPGWKAVAGRSNRAFSDTEAALNAVIAAGYDEALVYERKPKTLTALESLMGKSEFAEKLGEYIIKPQGKPTLVPMSDKREPYNTAASDFKSVAS